MNEYEEFVDEPEEAECGPPRERNGPRRREPRPALGALPSVPAGRVTALHERRAGSGRYVLSIDGAPVALVSAELVARNGVRVGAQIDAAAAQGIAREAAQLAVFDKAVGVLAARPRSARELELRLRRAGAPTEMVAQAVDRLRELGVVDDEAYARNLARSRVVSGGASRRRIAQELQRKGVDRRLADGAVAEVLEEVELDEEGAARAAAEKRLRALRGLDADTARRRLHGYLARRGYDGDLIARVVRGLLA